MDWVCAGGGCRTTVKRGQTFCAHCQKRKDEEAARMESQESNVFDDINRQTHYRCYYCEREVEYSFAGNNWRHTGTGVTHCDCVATPSNVEIPMTVDEIVATLPDEKPVD